MKLFSVSDTRSDDWFLMNSVWMPLSITAIYVYFVLVFGPRIMKTRAPMQLDTVIKLYNITQIILNTYLTERVSFILSLFDRPHLHEWTCLFAPSDPLCAFQNEKLSKDFHRDWFGTFCHWNSSATCTFSFPTVVINTAKLYGGSNNNRAWHPIVKWCKAKPAFLKTFF